MDVENPPPTPPKDSSIIPVQIEDEMKDSYIDYAMSVIISRALPDVRDGLKPVHRRILYAMDRLGLGSTRPFKKCARVVGDVMGQFHPHGDAAIYEALVRMAQEFAMRLPLVAGQGNFGSVDGDPPAAMRYTECRLSKLAEENLLDLEKETVDFVPNFDDSLEEPSVLPSKVPNLLLNGADGIAVGMATKMPPHNLREVVTCIVHLIDQPQASIEDLLNFIPGPDFPTGGQIVAHPDIREAYKTGRGRVIIRARTEYEELPNGKTQIVVREIPYQVNKGRLLENIAQLVRDKKVEGISDLRDESDRQGMRIVIELKRGEVGEIILNQLLKHTDLQTTFSVNMVVLVDSQPKLVNLKDLCSEFIRHRKEVIVRRTKFELKKAKERAHILEGLKVALENIDEVIKIIKTSKDVDIARSSLMGRFALSHIQSQSILDMRLQKLTSLETEKLLEELAALVKEITRLEGILSDVQKVLAIIKEELLDLVERFGDERRSEFVSDSADFDPRDLLEDETKVVTVTKTGYVKKLALDTYRRQNRGGKGLTGIDLKEEDLVEHTFVANTFDTLVVFTDQGKCWGIPVYKIPEGSRTSRGKSVANLLAIPKGEAICALLAVKSFETEESLVVVTKRGLLKRTPLTEFKGCTRATGVIAHAVQDGDKVLSVALSDGTREIVLGTKMGQAIRFNETTVRTCGRNSQGVIGIRLDDGDEVCGMEVLREGAVLLVVTENGYGKRTPLTEYRVTNRGGKGIINIRLTDKKGLVAAFREVCDGDEIVISTAQGIIFRTGTDAIRLCGRDSQGVRLMQVNPAEDKVVAVMVIKGGSETDDGQGEDKSASPAVLPEEESSGADQDGNGDENDGDQGEGPDNVIN